VRFGGGRDHDHGHAVSSEAAGKVEATLVTEADVDEHQIRPQRSHLAECLSRARCGAHDRDAVPVKACARDLEKALVVVDQQAALWYEISVTFDGNPSDVDRSGRLVTLRPTGALSKRIVPA